jgi:hypothetical protein
MATIKPTRSGSLPDSSAKSDFHNLVDDSKLTDGSQGDIIYYDGSNWVNLAAGTSGYYLKTQGAANNPIWAQVVVSSLHQGLITATAAVITHNLGLTFPYVLPIAFSDNNSNEIKPDSVVFGANALTATLSSFTVPSATASAFGYNYVG